MENWVFRLKEMTKQAKVMAKKIESHQKTKESAQEKPNIPRLEKSLAEIKRLSNNFPDSEIKSGLLQWIEQENEFIKKIKEELRYKFGAELKELLEKDGIGLKGQLPVLRAGFYTLKLNFELGFATLYWGPEIQIIKAKIPLSVENIYETIHNFNLRIKKQAVAPQDFLNNLHRAYQRYTSFNNIPYGNRVLLIDLLAELVLLSQPSSFSADPSKDKFREYSRVQFSYDLYNLKKSEGLKQSKVNFKLSVATFDATTDKAKSIWVPDNEAGDGTFYSFITFEVPKATSGNT